MRIVPVHAADHVPAIGFKPLGRIVGEPTIGDTINTDFVVIPECDQLVQPPGAGQRRRFVADAFHQAAIAQERPGAVIDKGVAIAIEMLGQ